LTGLSFDFPYSRDLFVVSVTTMCVVLFTADSLLLFWFYLKLIFIVYFVEVILFAVPRPLPQSSAPRLLPCQGNFLSPQLLLDLKSQFFNFFAKFFIEFKSKLLYTVNGSAKEYFWELSSCFCLVCLVHCFKSGSGRGSGNILARSDPDPRWDPTHISLLGKK
jgi:hypothetical protein